MKILFASDIHGSVYDMYRLVERIEEEAPDRTVLLGDFCGTCAPNLMREALEKINTPLDYLVGNSDRESVLSSYGLPTVCVKRILTVGDRKIFATHGHLYNRYRLPKMEKGDVFVYGHLHVPSISAEDGIFLVNSGSMAFPRNGSKKAYAVVDETGISIKEGFYGDIIERIMFD